MSDWKFPTWLYNALPFFYVFAGLFTMIVLRNGMARFAGLTLIAAGVLVWTLRFRSRRNYT